MDVTIRGITFPDIDLTDAEVVDTYADGVAAVQNLKKPKAGDVKGTANFIRDLCDTMREWFDDILGDGAGDKILPRDSMRDALTSFRELIEAQQQANKETNALWQEFDSVSPETSEPPLSCEQRRAQKRLGRRTRGKKKAHLAAVSDTPSPTDPYSPERLES